MRRRALWCVLSCASALTLACYSGVDEGDELAGETVGESLEDEGTGTGGTGTTEGTGTGTTEGTGTGTTEGTETASEGPGTGESSSTDGESSSGEESTSSEEGEGSTSSEEGEESTTGQIPPSCSAEGAEIVALINEYRVQNGESVVPLAPSLCVVAQTHVVDLSENEPDAAPECNLHSWSDQGSWSPCCYTADHAQAQCMWDKPGQLTTYPGYGYENAAGAGGFAMTPAYAVDLWKGSPGHNAVMLSEGIWESHPWEAMGAGIHDGFAVVWFGEQTDPEG